MTDQHILILDTCLEDVTAANVTAVLVEAHLAACVNRLGRMASTERYFGWLSQSVAPSGGSS